MRKLKVYETAHEVDQLASAARLPADPLISRGNISDIMTHGTAPIPIEKDPMYTSNPLTASAGIAFRAISYVFR